MSHLSPQGTRRYIHGTAPVEQDRLALMNRVMNPPALRELRLREGDHVLDVGCGLGLLARDMARVVAPGGRVVGVDASEEQLAEARRRAGAGGEEGLVDLRAGDAVSLPLEPDEWKSFHVVHARFLLEHVPDPLAVVKAMVRAARPGGRIVLQDDAHDILRLDPEPEGFGKLWEVYWRSYRSLGCDPLAVR